MVSKLQFKIINISKVSIGYSVFVCFSINKTFANSNLWLWARLLYALLKLSKV